MVRRSDGGINRSGFIRFLRGTGALLVFGVAANAVGYAFHVAMGRFLPSASFARLSAILAAFAILEMLLPAIQMNVAEHVARLRHTEPVGLAALLRRVMLVTAWAGFAAAVALIVAGWFLVDDHATLMAAAGLVFTFGFSAVFAGILQGQERFAALGALGLTASLARLVAAVALVLGGAGLAGAMAGEAIRPLFITAVGLALVGIPASAGRAPAHERDFIRFGAPVVVGMMAATALASLDVILVERLFAPEIAGAYARAAVIGKAALFTCVAAGLVLFPMVAASDPASARKLLLRALVVSFALCSLGVGILAVAADPILRLTFGAAQPEAAEVLPFLAFAMTLVGGVHLLLRYFLARRDTRAVWGVVLAALAEGAALLAFHGSLLEVALATATVGGVATIAGSWWAFRPGITRSRRTAAAP